MHHTVLSFRPIFLEYLSLSSGVLHFCQLTDMQTLQTQTVAAPELGLPCVLFDSHVFDYSSPSLPRLSNMFGDGHDEPDAPSPHYEKTIVSTNATNKLTDHTSKFHELSQTSSQEEEDRCTSIINTLEKLSILTKESATLKEQDAQHQAR